MKSSAAISLFVRPCAASSATRRSVSVSSSDAGARPLIRLSSARAFSAHSRAPSSSKIASACSSASRAARFCCACRRTDTETEQRPAALQRKPPASASERSNAACAADNSPSAARRRPRQRVAPALAYGLPSRSALRLVRLEVGTRQLQLAEADERLDGVGPDGKGRIVHSARKETPGELAEVVTGRLEVAELELEPTQDAERGDDEDLVRNRLRVGEHLVHRGMRVVDETEIGLEQRLRPSDPVLGVRMLRLLRQLVRCGGVLERPGPASGEPLERHSTARGPSRG